MVYGIPKISQRKVVCEGCMSGKQHMDKFITGKSWRSVSLGS
jgi:hypothetical protein